MSEENVEEFSLYLNNEDGEIRIIVEHENAEIMVAIQYRDDEHHYKLFKLLVEHLAAMVDDSLAQVAGSSVTVTPEDIAAMLVAQSQAQEESSESEPEPARDPLEDLWEA